MYKTWHISWHKALAHVQNVAYSPGVKPCGTRYVAYSFNSAHSISYMRGNMSVPDNSSSLFLRKAAAHVWNAAYSPVFSWHKALAHVWNVAYSWHKALAHVRYVAPLLLPGIKPWHTLRGFYHSLWYWVLLLTILLLLLLLLHESCWSGLAFTHLIPSYSSAPKWHADSEHMVTAVW